ncbi:amidohydrolase [Halorubrum distributum JCM 9100]|uniref:Amidohydrolase n=4 Tax=Halorubrum distributum TaxID=29283 RepID=M0EKX3_9EURY|nr:MULTISPECIES: amidohydrolase [Halorubrum distributum group]ELZ29454.1 amidohydrolase [Halorubrum terrestre JCM 10247]ELZ47044.1 amidohydrolase [Halorubrum distributum JCM 9100]ELZ55608.1 amidohydrolase [Halorubrum distributum JCM 10118]MYL69061.1 amidohydrolase family protein [Halorubrum terrestre]
MTEAADRIFVNGEVHTLADPEDGGDADDGGDAVHEAVAVRDGEIVRTGRTHDVELLAGVDTDVVDLDGRVLLPGFIDAHTHLTTVGRYLVHADLSAADSPDAAVDLLAERAAEVESEANGVEAPDGDGEAEDWVLGYGYDESTWDESRYLTRADLDRVSTERPVAAFREDMHVAAVNGVALDRFADALADAPDETVPTDDDGEPTGVLLEAAIDPIYRAVEPGPAETRAVVEAALEHCAARGITRFHDMVRDSHAPRVYRDLDAAGELTARVRINYWSDHLDAAREVGLATNAGSEMVETGAIKSYTDGSLGGRTARLSEPYADAPGETGQWVVDPDELNETVAEATEAGFQFTTHAIGDEAVDAVLDAYEDASRTDPGEARHQIEHVELADDDAIERLAETGVVASVQPNFLKWAREDGLYEERLGPERTAETNRYREMLDAGVELAFGSDGMPMDPLVGVHHAVNAPAAAQRLTVTEALRAYTSGAAYAGFDEDRLGTIEAGKRADLVALDNSPWERDDAIDEIDVALTVVDGEVVFDDR